MEEIKTGSFRNSFLNNAKTRKVLVNISIVVLVLAFIVTSATLINNKIKSQSNICTQKANLPLMNQAASAIKDTDTSALLDLASKVSTLSNYKKDPNCLYVLFQSTIQVGNLPKAQSYLTNIERIFPKNGLYVAFDIHSAKQINTIFNNEKAAINEAASNTIYLSDPKYAK